jgi:hypothetical protein
MYKISIRDWGSTYRLWMYCDESVYTDRIVYKIIDDINFINCVQSITGVSADDSILELSEDEYNDIYTLFDAFNSGQYKPLLSNLYKDPTPENLQKLKVKILTKELFALEFMKLLNISYSYGYGKIVTMVLFDSKDMSHRIFYHRTRTSYLFGCVERLLINNPVRLEWDTGDVFVSIEDEEQVEILMALVQAAIGHRSALLKKYYTDNNPETLKLIKAVAISSSLFSLESCTLYNSSEKLVTIARFI